MVVMEKVEMITGIESESRNVIGHGTFLLSVFRGHV